MEKKGFGRRKEKQDGTSIPDTYIPQISSQPSPAQDANKTGNNLPPIETVPPIPLVRVAGNYEQMGGQIGEACVEQVRHSIQNARNLIEGAYADLQLTWEGAIIQAKKYLPFAQECYPQYVRELEGMAEGAGVSFDDIMVVNAMEGVTMDALHLTRCTSMAVNEERTADGHVLVAHNEDWLPEDEQDVYLVHATPDDEPQFLAMSYGGLLVNIGFNAAGIAQCCDSVYPKDLRIGIPRVFLSRGVLAAENPEDAIRRTVLPHRAAGYNHLLVHDSGEQYNVEVSARRYAVLSGEDGLIMHTNHYLDYNMQLVENEAEELIATRVRFFRAQRLLKQIPLHTLKTLKTIQRDHVNFPNSICNHCTDDIKPLDRQKTINALIIDLTAKTMHISWGNPCSSRYHTYYL
jgi:isopenicillin-N N-acyltransferase-like protein